MQQSEHGRTDRDVPRRINANIWGWKWSWVSLGIILCGFIFLLFVGPKQDDLLPAETNEAPSVRTDSTETEGH